MEEGFSWRESFSQQHSARRKLTPALSPPQAILGANVAQLAQAVLPPIFEMWQEEEERDVVNEILNSFSAALMVVGPALIVPGCALRAASLSEPFADPFLQTSSRSAPTSTSSSGDRLLARSMTRRRPKQLVSESSPSTMPLSSAQLAISSAQSRPFSVATLLSSSLPSFLTWLNTT